MNKKFYYGLFAAGMLFATSCSNDDLTQVQSGEYADVSISLGVEEVAGSRAISDGSGANELHYAVFDKDGNRISSITAVHDKEVTFPTTETITLAKGQTYKVAFWAQNKACNAYTVSDMMNVTVDYAGINNDEIRDAFFKTVEFTVNGSTSLDVELKRPFAQINVGVETTDWNAAVASGVEIKESNVTIENAATSINLVTGKVDGSVKVDYTTAAIPAEPLKANNSTYNWLSMSYILVNDGSETGDEETTLTSLNYTFTPESGNTITFSEGLNNVPVKRNWRTNILGKILTGDIQFNISIDPIYDGDINYPKGDAQALEMAATFGGTVTLTEDVTLTEPLKVMADMVLDLNGKSIIAGLKEEGRHHYAIENYATMFIKGTGVINGRGIENFGTMTIDGDLTITNVDTNGGAAVWNEGKLTINGGTFATNSEAGAGSYGAALNTRASGEAIVNGGTFKANSQLTYAIINAGKTTINYAKVEAKHGAVGHEAGATTDIYGGTFEQTSNPGTSDHCIYGAATIYGGSYKIEQPNDAGGKVFYDAIIANGYTIVEKNNVFYVVPGMVAALSGVEEATEVSFTENLNVHTGTTIHTQDAEADITIKGNGYSVVSTANSANDFQWTGGTIPAMSTIFSSANGSKVTVNDLSFEGTMSALMLGHYQNANYNNYNTVLNNVNVVGTKVVSFSSNVAPAVCVYGTAVLNNCNIYGTTLSPLDTDPMWPVYDVAAVNYSKTTINGGKIGSIFIWNQAGLVIENGAAIESIIVRGNMNTTKYGVTIKAGTSVGTIDLSAITDKSRVNFTIEDGAIVGKIIANGEEYDSINDFMNY